MLWDQRSRSRPRSVTATIPATDPNPGAANQRLVAHRRAKGPSAGRPRAAMAGARRARQPRPGRDGPADVFEVHPGSWRASDRRRLRPADDRNGPARSPRAAAGSRAPGRRSWRHAPGLPRRRRATRLARAAGRWIAGAGSVTAARIGRGRAAPLGGSRCCVCCGARGAADRWRGRRPRLAPGAFQATREPGLSCTWNAPCPRSTPEGPARTCSGVRWNGPGANDMVISARWAATIRLAGRRVLRPRPRVRRRTRSGVPHPARAS